MSLLFMRERGMTITEEQRTELTRWTQSRTLPAGDVFRARLMLALAEGRNYREIMSSLQTTAPTISRWKQRFEQSGIDGLDALHKGSEPRVADAALQARIAQKTKRKPIDGSTHWTCRKMELRDSHASKVSLLMRFSRHRHVQLIALRLFHFDLRAALLHGALVSVLTDDNRSSKP